MQVEPSPFVGSGLVFGGSLGDCDYVAIAVDDFCVVLAYVREHATAAVFEAAFIVFEVAAAVFA